MLCDALDQKKRVELEYRGHKRIVEVHLVGKNTANGVEHALVWQVSGGSNSGVEQGWKDLHINNISNPAIMDLASQAPRDDYVTHRSQYTGIVDEIECEV